MNLQSVEQWQVQDSTKLQSYMTCPRAYFYEYVLGWRKEEPNNHLVFGEAWHKAMETLLEYGYSDEAVVLAQIRLEETYRAHFSPMSDDIYFPKTPGFAAEMLGKYVREYPRDLNEFEVLYTEVSGSVSVDSRLSLYFKTDSILRGVSGFLKDKVFSLEHKTTGSNNRQWAQQWQLKTQVGTYTHVLNCLFPQDQVYGVIINGAIFQKTKPGFVRIHAPKTPVQMQVWLMNVRYWMNDIIDQFERLSHESSSDSLLLAFPLNTEACTKYFGCQYLDFCSAWANPLQHCEVPPIGYTVNHWDPRQQETTHKMELA